MSDVIVQQQPEILTPITEIAPAPASISSVALILSDESMDRMIRIADLMSTGKTTIPKHLQGNQGDCFAVCMQAMQWGMNPFSVAQKTHLVNGTLGYEAQLVIAVLNSSPALATRLNFAWSDNWAGTNGKTDKSPDRWAQVWATLRGETEARLRQVTMAEVGDVRNSPNWVADPKQQLAYLTAKRWGRLHAPDVILGVYTPDELQDGVDYATGQPINMQRATPARIAGNAADSSRPARTPAHDAIVKKLEDVARNLGFEPFKEEWTKLSKDDRTAIGLRERDRIAAIAGAPQAQQQADGAPQDEGTGQREPGGDDE
ncbi:RecT family recombinase [Burkholderia sp. LMG 13014]|uniref:RecT family recombinase n=1 Tax=Burkholderia sp. LMG 13014 TaxID=2709306 RepID=UPI0019667DAD|nr:RecT family recombinase [Burkholderia sp. LMG 13014]